ncbi:MAG: hypothetical protein H7230_00120 [Candidatus Parcubacteria bacterium]|nr:hypothetical protein [Candidatus Paceibacterota bacterium]
MATLIKSKTISTKASVVKNKVLTFRFSATPRMLNDLSNLENEYAMLDRTEIVKLALSELIKAHRNGSNAKAGASPASFETQEEAMEWLLQDKSLYRA